MSKVNGEKPNYKNRKKKKVHIEDKKRFILAVLLALTIGFGSYTAADLVNNAVDSISDNYHYELESKSYKDMVNKEKITIVGTNDKMLDIFDIAKKFKQINFVDTDDVYHGLIECARFFQFNTDKNFKDFIWAIDLDKMAQENPIYPTSLELDEFLKKHNFLLEDGSIDFESWRDYDKELFNMQRELEEFKESKK